MHSMNAVPFDTLKLARGLEEAGMPPQMAAGTVAALAEAMGSADLATKADVGAVKADVGAVKEDVGAVKEDVTALKADVTAVKADVTAVKADVTALKEDVTALKEDVTALKADVGAMKTDVGAVKADVGTVRTEIAASESRVMAVIAAFKADVDRRFEASDAKLELLRRDMTIKLGGMLIVATGVILAALRLMPHS
jgi:polyhydroxyalkanoate synthesis regulator phasin